MATYYVQRMGARFQVSLRTHEGEEVMRSPMFPSRLSALMAIESMRGVRLHDALFERTEQGEHCRSFRLVSRSGVVLAYGPECRDAAEIEHAITKVKALASHAPVRDEEVRR